MMSFEVAMIEAHVTHELLLVGLEHIAHRCCCCIVRYLLPPRRLAGVVETLAFAFDFDFDFSGPYHLLASFKLLLPRIL